MIDSERQTGRTTQQIREAPYGAYYVVHGAHEIRYTKQLARQIGRDDLKFISLGMIGKGMFRGVRIPGLTLDHHAAELMRPTDWEHYYEALCSVEPQHSIGK